MASANEAVGIPVTSVKSIGFNIFVMPVFRALNTEKILALTEKLFHSKCDQRYFKERNMIIKRFSVGPMNQPLPGK